MSAVIHGKLSLLFAVLCGMNLLMLSCKPSLNVRQSSSVEQEFASFFVTCWCISAMWYVRLSQSAFLYKSIFRLFLLWPDRVYINFRIDSLMIADTQSGVDPVELGWHMQAAHSSRWYLSCSVIRLFLPPFVQGCNPPACCQIEDELMG